jgi:hypothetical protein
MPAGNGVAGVPLCDRAAYSPTQPNRPPTQSEDRPRSTYQPDYFSAVAWHPESTSFWASARNATRSGAEFYARQACEKEMGEGCSVFSQTNGATAAGLDYNGTLVFQNETTIERARERLQASCNAVYTCAPLAAFSSDTRFQSGGAFVKAQPLLNVIGPANPQLARKKYGAVAWVFGAGYDKSFVATGHSSVATATAAAMTACTRYYASRQQCQLLTVIGNGVILFVRTDKGDNFIPHQTLARAEIARENYCRQTGARTCTTVSSFDVTTAGLAETKK